MTKTLVLFDIDGTLLQTLGAGIRGMNAAFGLLYGRPDALDGLAIAGRTDLSILGDAFAKIGVRPGTLGATGYTDLIKSELVRWKEVIRAGNIRAD